MKYRLSFLFLIASLALGCSNQWRDADAQITASEMLGFLNESATTSGSGGDMATAQALSKDESAAIYFADGGGKSPWTVASAASLVDWSFLGSAGGGLWYGNISEVRVFLIDTFKATTPNAALIISIKKTGETAFTHYAFTGSRGLGGSDYQAVLNNGSNRLVLRSTDVVDGDLDAVIQLKVFVQSSGGEEYIGKFSTLVGFGE